MEFLGKLDKFDFNHWHFYFPIPISIANQMMDAQHRRELIWIKNESPYHLTLMKSKEFWYVLVNQELRKELQTTFNSVTGKKADNQKFKYPRKNLAQTVNIHQLQFVPSKKNLK